MALIPSKLVLFSFPMSYLFDIALAKPFPVCSKFPDWKKFSHFPGFPVHVGTMRTQFIAFETSTFLLLFLNFLLDQGPFCGATDCPFFGLCVNPPWVLKPGWFSHLHSCLLVHGESKGHVWCFSTSRGVHTISMYTPGSPFGYPSCKRWRAGSDQ